MAVNKNSQKKRIVTSYDKLSDELKAAFKVQYPTGHTEFMIRIDKPNGEFFYGVMLETEEINYLVKVAVKIDDSSEDDIEKDIYGTDEPDEIQGADEIADSEESDD